MNEALPELPDEREAFYAEMNKAGLTAQQAYLVRALVLAERAAVAAAIQQERERCALTCEEVGTDLIEAAARQGHRIDGQTVDAVARVCASEIRSGINSPQVDAAIRATPPPHRDDAPQEKPE